MTAAPSRSRQSNPTIRSLVRRPVWVLALLLGVLAANIGIAFLPIDPLLKTGLHLLLAAVTVGFIAFIFMELGHKGATMRLFAASGFVWLAILFLLIFSDYATRP